MWGLGASGYANEFYAAAAQAGTQSWKAFFFGSFDSANLITVDKPPAALWPMEIAGRIFGFNSWSMLVPQAIEGVLSVWLLYATVRRWFGHGAGLLAGALLAITPVAVLMFRFNNPDALMVLLIVLAAYCTTRALENAATKWLLLAGVVLGFSFLAKGLQPFTVLPALALAYLVAAPTSWPRRLLQLLAAGVAIIVGAGWWVLAVDLTPASSRPYIGGSGDNSALGLAFGYNGLDRLNSSGGPGGGGGGGASFSGASGVGRLFNDLNGGQIAWLLPTALLALIALVVVSAKAPLADRTRAAAIIWGGWLLVTGAVLSYAGGIIHTYYTVELAPAVAALVATGTVVLWRRRHTTAARLALAAGVVVTAVWTFQLLGRTADFAPWLRWLLLVAAAGAAVILVLPRTWRRRTLVTAAAALGIAVLGGGSTAYALDTVNTPHTGSTPSAGPSTGGGFGGPGGGRGGFGRGNGGPGGNRGGGPEGGGFPGAQNGGFPGTEGGAPGGAPGGQDGAPGGGAGERPGAPGGSGRGSGDTQGGMGGGMGGSNATLNALIAKTDTTWAAATIGSQTAGSLELATGKAVMAIGGFSGSDDAPTLAQFKAYVAAGKVRYFVSGGGMGGGMGGRGGQSAGSAISSWVSANYTATTVGGTTVYDLSTPKASS
ncbi:ArnT family glycosyltransferase [Jatrophihabitans endophyticus]|uniref:ArnT family glycosyltransferase n=1 Tax=Jatrophihabitans endophyticus TaxID=1206085 RepID=UPI00190EC0C0|nr:glycosyltransferase family 39 protein [Jatrophihabitans endophyticus]